MVMFLPIYNIYSYYFGGIDIKDLVVCDYICENNDPNYYHVFVRAYYNEIPLQDFFNVGYNKFQEK